MICIAIIDDGVNVIHPDLIASVEVTDDLQIAAYEIQPGMESHATVCYRIIKKYAPACKTLSVKILDGHTRRCDVCKLIAGLLLGLGLCLLLLGGYLLTGWLVLPHSPEEDLTAMAVVGFTLLGALPIWCGVYGLCHMMAMLIPSTAGWLSIYYVLTFFGQPVLVALIVTFTQGSVSSLIQAVLMPFSLLMPNYLSGWITWEYQVWCWTIGLGWMAVTTMLGLFCLDKKEIK